MEGNVLTQHSVLSLALSDSGLILFAALLVFFGLAMGFVFVLKSNKMIYRVLIGTLSIIFLLLVGIVALDAFGASGAYFTFAETKQLSDTFSTHRWLIIQLPILLSISSILILLTYRDRIADAHAVDYRRVVQVSTCVSFLSVLLIALESLV